MKLLHEGDLYEDNAGSGSESDPAGDIVVPTLCETCSYLAGQFGSSAEGSKLRGNVVDTWGNHVKRHHPENESLSKSIATMEAIQAKRKH